MTYRYYRFPNKNVVPPLNKWPEGVSVCEVGYLTKDDGIYNELGEEIKPPSVIYGWHINVCYQNNPNLDFVKQFEIFVDTPKRKWLGQD